MPSMVRVIAEYAGDRENPADNSYSFTADLCVDQDGRCLHHRHFGFAKDGADTYPFIIDPPKSDGDHGLILWGASSEDDQSRITLFDKALVTGELFTRIDSDETEYTYRVVQVIDMAQAGL